MGGEATRFKPGQVATPGGRPKIPDELKAHKVLTKDEVSHTIAMYARMDAGALQELSVNPATKGIDRAIILNILDHHKLPIILDRVIGKVTEVVANIHVDYNPEEYQEIPAEALIKLVSGK
jgi:hypothetical protein